MIETVIFNYYLIINCDNKLYPAVKINNQILYYTGSST